MPHTRRPAGSVPNLPFQGRHLPLKQASQISARALRHVLQVTEGVSARVFRMFNDLAVAAIEAGTECISDASVEAWRPRTKPTQAYA